MLKGLPFTDMYLGENSALVSGIPGMFDPVPVESKHQEEVDQLRQKCLHELETHRREDFPLRHREVGYRVSVIHSLTEVVFVLRRFAESVPKLETMGIHSRIIQNLLTPKLSGLIVIAGAYGQGKTTTASSIIVSRLSQYGGVAVTIEDPPEMPLQGKHGEGVCYQTWVERGGFASACRQATRWAPSIIFLGEIRDGETAIEALRASVNGRLVVATTHAENALMAIDRIHALAVSAGGTSSEDVTQLLAAGLTCVMHQKIETHGERKQLFVSSLWIQGEDAAGIRATIQSKRFNLLGSALDLQRNQMLTQRQAVK
jgi:Tfp pilus assembly pilus retraction ATPase PilT